MAILPRRPEHQSVLDIPTPPLQQAAVFVIFFFTALAFVSYILRAVTRIRTRQWGLDDYLITGAMIFSLMMIGPFYMCKSAVLTFLFMRWVISNMRLCLEQISSWNTLAGTHGISQNLTQRRGCGGFISPSSSTTRFSPSSKPRCSASCCA